MTPSNEWAILVQASEKTRGSIGMVINIRKAGIHLEVLVEEGNAKTDLGLLDRPEQWELYNVLTEAAAEISEHLNKTYFQHCEAD